MQSRLKLFKRLVQKSGPFCLVIFCLWSPQTIAQTRGAAGSVSSAAVASSEHDPLVDAAFDHFYNMDYDRAIPEFEKVLDRRPNDPQAVNHVMSAVLMRELNRMGAMNSRRIRQRQLHRRGPPYCRPRGEGADQTISGPRGEAGGTGTQDES